MEPVTMIIAGVAIVISASLALAVKKYQEIKRKNLEIESLRRSLNAYVETYSLENADEQLIRRCQNKINELFHGEIEKEFLKYKTVEEKKAFAQKVSMELVNCMGIKVDSIQFEYLGPNTRGVTVPENDVTTVYFNEVLLVDDPVQLVKTMCHEFKHCIQFQSFTNNVWCYSPQKVAQWLYSWDNYVPCESIESYEAYVKQIIEIDANKFVDSIFNVK